MEETKKVGIQLPTKVKEEASINISSLILYGLPKSGKTTSIAQLPECLIIDTEQGTSFIKGAYVSTIPEDVGPVGKFKWLKELAAEIKKQGRPYQFVAVDTLTQLDELSEAVGTFNYMNTPQGKTFNRAKDGSMLKPNDPAYESVISLANGYGYRYTREALIDIFNTLKGLGSIATIFVCHVSDKMMAKADGTEVMIKDLAMTGKLKDILPRNVDAVAKLYNEEGKTMISFIGSEHKVGGIRAPHLIGYEGPLDWSKIFIEQ